MWSSLPQAAKCQPKELGDDMIPASFSEVSKSMIVKLSLSPHLLAQFPKETVDSGVSMRLGVNQGVSRNSRIVKLHISSKLLSRLIDTPSSQIATTKSDWDSAKLPLGENPSLFAKNVGAIVSMQIVSASNGKALEKTMTHGKYCKQEKYGTRRLDKC